MATAKMKIILPLVVWIWLHFITTTTGQSFGGIGFGIKREIFFLNLEDGYFGCQVNESTDVLQLFELSKLCDGTPNCFLGSDELTKELKCTDDCRKDDGTECQNGACLDNQCYCNDGYGGCSCEVPDENECKYRPCDVFAHCTNTLGSFSCTCFPGYQGDGFRCEDINECDDPAIAARCVENAECCNLPAHFLCKCNPGFQGDGEVQCLDLDECQQPNACGQNALCQNTPGNYTCLCPEGFYGNPFDGCVDVDECEHLGACGAGATCTNLVGGRQCHCPPGYEGDPYTTGCLDTNECGRSPCGRNALCSNLDGSFKCSCPPGFIGDPMSDCSDINECDSNPCSATASCLNTNGSYTCMCPEGYTGSANEECVDINECGKPGACGINAKCINVPGSFKCICPPGFTGQGHLYCENVNECEPNPCGQNAICKDTVGSYICTCKEDFTGDPFKGCTDIDECATLDKPCGTYAICENAVPGYNCICPQGYQAKPSPEVACEQVDVNILCQSNFDCTNNAECIENQCFCQKGFIPKGSVCVDINECKNVTGPCGPYSNCLNDLGSFHCECQNGYVGAPPMVECKAPCEDVKCGNHAYCKPDGDEAYCICEDGWTFNPSDISAGCIDIDECDKANGPSGRCGANAQCTNLPGTFACQCEPGFTGNPNKQCSDVNECSLSNTCGLGAVCKNLPGGYTCECPEGTVPDPDAKTKCNEIVTCLIDADCPGNALCDEKKRCLCPEPNIGNDCRHPCESVNCAPNEECLLSNHIATCICSTGYTNTSLGCADINECIKNPCQSGAICKNEPGTFSCQCPGGTSGDPYRSGCTRMAPPSSGCSNTNPCPAGEQCILDEFTSESVCICVNGFVRDRKTGKCRDRDECTEFRDKEACGINAICKNLPGSYDCQCPPGFNGNPFLECLECNSPDCRCQPPYELKDGNCVLASCGPDNSCPNGAECISITGGVSYCACPKGYKPSADGTCEDINECMEQQQICGYGAACINKPGVYECHCPEGYSGDPYNGLCSPAQKKCINDRECPENERCVQPGECACPPPYFTDILDENKCKSPCERFPCGLNANCTPSDPPRCACKTGYEGDPLQGCMDIDECKDNPCGYGAHCLNLLEGYKCICPKGMTGDPYKGGCIIEPPGTGKSECQFDRECVKILSCQDGTCISPCAAVLCGSNSRCRAENHKAVCECNAGFIKDPKGKCVSPCDNFTCALGAQCIVSTRGPTCRCEEGLMGNPFPGGQCTTDICSSSRPCDKPKVCISGRCKQRCEGIICGVGAHCDKNSNKCICDQNLAGNPDVICMPPSKGPACEPGCGKNAHCEYGTLTGQCICNIGTTGNPYEVCEKIKIQDRTGCSATACGTNAGCVETFNGIECSCSHGFAGNAYLECKDIDECNNNVCGNSAVCINTIGSYDCRCKEGYAGNPFVMCTQVQGGICRDPENCQCKADLLCPNGYSCKRGQCTNLCNSIRCGPKAACNNGQCECSPGYIGNPDDLVAGCKIYGQCTSDIDCSNTEICFQIGKGVRKCVDACTKAQCGPNALCVTDRHRTSCICSPGYHGKPTDLSLGCQIKERINPRECLKDADCKFGTICAIDSKGVQKCINPCETVACGSYEACKIDVAGHPTCACKDEYLWNPVKSACEKPSVPECNYDNDCERIASCQPDALGIMKCVPVCAQFTCPNNSACVAEAHKGQCQCYDGYSGNPNGRNGCQLVKQDSCTTDAQCSEHDTCRPHLKDNQKTCLPACDLIKCGPNAICAVNNHVPKCQCPSGSYIGDPNNPSQGCESVPCVYNIDCPPTQLCNRLTHTCHDVCDEESCGTNAVCIGVDHKGTCQCPPGYSPNPIAEVECVLKDSCKSNPCHATAVCEPTHNGYNCVCPKQTVGDPFISGCRQKGNCPNGDKDCPQNTICNNGNCINPCSQKLCGSNAICRVVDKKAICNCQTGYKEAETGIQDGCLRVITTCGSDVDCGNEVCHKGQCRPVCRDNEDCSQGESCSDKKCVTPCADHSQCLGNQACIEGMCIIGCRSNKNCPSEHACINNQCQDPCQNKDVCGPNAICSRENHKTVCDCPAGFEGNPTPQQGCIRIPTLCNEINKCPENNVCFNGQCTFKCNGNSECALGERCTNKGCLKVCFGDSNCLTGEICTDEVCQPGCARDADCKTSEACIKGKCKCTTGFIGTPQGCVDINECEANPCHESSICKNQIGSYKCVCPEGMVGDPYTSLGCSGPGQCRSDKNCPDSLMCKRGKCRDPCEAELTKCGVNALCEVTNHRLACACPPGHLGNPFDKNLGCFKVECIEKHDCPTTRFCNAHSNKCIDPCDFIDCGKGSCLSENHDAVCLCLDGYQLFEDKCVNINECEENHPCHPTAQCIDSDGGFSCICEEGLVGDPITTGCRKPGDCLTDADCPSSAYCDNETCRNPCELKDACGINAKCLPIAHKASCSCPEKTKEDLNHNCISIECTDNNDCVPGKACISSVCVNPCSLPNVCGHNAECTPTNHLATCTCSAGTTGDPHLGCISVQYCGNDNQCPQGLNCYNGICTSLCASSRDCITDQLCIQGYCQPICKSNSSCPQHQFCLDNICQQEIRCRANDDCEHNEKCLSNAVGQPECINACESIICGRNAECVSNNHKAQCICKPGFKGNPTNDKVGCQKIECETDKECSSDKLCDQNMCKIACLVHNPCGKNTLCSAEDHKQVCYCQPGNTGDPLKGCTVIDFCADEPCGPKAVCTNSRGSFKCLCPPGLTGDSYNEGCRIPVECIKDTDCSGLASCDKTINKCKSVCENTLCGPNTECIAVDHVGHCSCRNGYEGSPIDLTVGCRPRLVNCKNTHDCPANTYCYGNICKQSCRENNECQLSEQCIQGQCLNPCNLPKSCGMNALCNVSKHNKICSCPEKFTGNHDIECIRLPVTCSSKLECGDNSTCKENICMPQCASDAECAFNEKCLKGDCMLTCRVDNDCFLGHICLKNKCIFGCHADEDCSSSESCIDNKCNNPCLENPCGPNAHCSVSNHRAICSCREGLVPNPSAKIACVRTPAEPCNQNADCSNDNICRDEFCRNRCTADAGCLNNERCENGVCKPICRKDDDCRNGEVCEGFKCVIGCRTSSGCAFEKSCINNKCVDPCTSPTACGTNARCSVADHQKLCECPEPLEGNPLESCKYVQIICTENSGCNKDQSCIEGICRATCRTDNNCLEDERCIRGACQAICNSDGFCGNGQICENRLCITGCRNNSVCPQNQACLNNICQNPCETFATCGVCADCTVTNHLAQCSCPANFFGDPLVSCIQAATKCNDHCECDGAGYCTKKCQLADDCSCGEICVNAQCRNKCSPQLGCAQGQICSKGACIPGCRSDSDCSNAETCKKGKCQNLCKQPFACGKNAICRVSDHRKLCLCPDGYQGDPNGLCSPYQCTEDDQCEPNKKCGADGVCVNPCQEQSACGVNAQCKIIDRKAYCSCPPGYIGNGLVECKQGGTQACLKNPCGHNAKCKDLPDDTYECTCSPGCIGDAYTGCDCDAKIVNLCKNTLCGDAAICKVIGGKPQCVCPSNRPAGDPTIECSLDRSALDCRTEGCGKNAECIREQAFFVCRCKPGHSGTPEIECRKAAECNNDLDCSDQKACINFQCVNPCSLRGACGHNAQCKTIQHRPRCTCPECYIGSANTACNPDPNCLKTQSRPAGTPLCFGDSECDAKLSCDINTGKCYDPCQSQVLKCKGNKKCEVHYHKPTCVCKSGFMVNERGEISCAPEQSECTGDSQCPSNQACIDQICQSPCTASPESPCPPGKGCDVVNHKPTCICLKNCSPSLSICLRDNGCPADQACRAFRCENPCITANCSENTPCRVEDHKPKCDSCPPGYKQDPKYGCFKDVQCRSHSECAPQQACINRKCQNPCLVSNPCTNSQDCQVQDHQPVCVKVCQCQKDNDCAHFGQRCDGCNCIIEQPRNPQCSHCPPGIPCHPISGACLKDMVTTPETLTETQSVTLSQITNASSATTLTPKPETTIAMEHTTRFFDGPTVTVSMDLFETTSVLTENTEPSSETIIHVFPATDTTEKFVTITPQYPSTTIIEEEITENILTTVGVVTDEKSQNPTKGEGISTITTETTSGPSTRSKAETFTPNLFTKKEQSTTSGSILLTQEPHITTIEGKLEANTQIISGENMKTAEPHATTATDKVPITTVRVSKESFFETTSTSPKTTISTQGSSKYEQTSKQSTSKSNIQTQESTIQNHLTTEKIIAAVTEQNITQTTRQPITTVYTVHKNEHYNFTTTEEILTNISHQEPTSEIITETEPTTATPTSSHSTPFTTASATTFKITKEKELTTVAQTITSTPLTIAAASTEMNKQVELISVPQTNTATPFTTTAATTSEISKETELTTAPQTSTFTPFTTIAVTTSEISKETELTTATQTTISTPFTTAAATTSEIGKETELATATPASTYIPFTRADATTSEIGKETELTTSTQTSPSSPFTTAAATNSEINRETELTTATQASTSTPFTTADASTSEISKETELTTATQTSTSARFTTAAATTSEIEISKETELTTATQTSSSTPVSTAAATTSEIGNETELTTSTQTIPSAPFITAATTTSDISKDTELTTSTQTSTSTPFITTAATTSEISQEKN